MKDAAGNALASDKTWAFTAASPPVTRPSTARPSIHSAADVVAVAHDGVLWNYPAIGRGGFQRRQKIGVGWSGLNKGFVTDWNSDGVFDLIAQWGWNSINGITAVAGFTTGSSGLMARLSDGRLAHYPFSKGTWGARTFVGRGWSTHNIFRSNQPGRDTNRPRRKTSWSCKPPHVFR